MLGRAAVRNVISSSPWGSGEFCPIRGQHSLQPGQRLANDGAAGGSKSSPRGEVSATRRLAMQSLARPASTRRQRQAHDRLSSAGDQMGEPASQPARKPAEQANRSGRLHQAAGKRPPPAIRRRFADATRPVIDRVGQFVRPGHAVRWLLVRLPPDVFAQRHGQLILWCRLKAAVREIGGLPSRGRAGRLDDGLRKVVRADRAEGLD